MKSKIENLEVNFEIQLIGKLLDQFSQTEHTLVTASG